MRTVYYRGHGIRKQQVVFFVFLFSVLALFMLYIRMRTGFRTPDENFYFFKAYLHSYHSVGFFGDRGQVAFKYWFTSAVFKWLGQYGEMVIYVFHICLVGSALAASLNSLFIHHSNLSRYWWAAMFMMPNVIFFTCAILRDIHIFALVVFMLVQYKKQKFGVLFFFCMVGIALLRPEIAAILCIAMIIMTIKRPEWRRTAVIIYLLAAVGLMVYLYKDNWYIEQFYKRFARGETTYGILGFERLNVNIAWVLVSNALLFLFPLTSEVPWHSFYAWVFIIPSVVNLFLVYGIAMRSRFSFTTGDRLHDLSVLSIVLFIPIAAHERGTHAAIRHSIYMLPFLYLAYNQCLERGINLRRKLDQTSKF